MPIMVKGEKPANFGRIVGDKIVPYLEQLWDLTKETKKAKLAETEGQPHRIQIGFFHGIGSKV